MKKSEIKKYGVNQGSMITMIILVVISSLSIVILSYYINIENTLPIEDIDTNRLVVFESLREVCVVLASICGCNLLVSTIIEVKSKNKYISQIIKDDVISAPEFYENMELKDKEKVYEALERSLYFNTKGTQDMFNSIRTKLSTQIDDYYYEECSYAVTCKVEKEYIEKTTIKKIKLRSYEEKFVVDKLEIGNYVGKSISGMKTYELKEFKINGNTMDLTRDIAYVDYEMNNLDEQNEYDTAKTIVYNSSLTLSNAESTTVRIKVVSRTKLDDRISTFRVIKPCKHFSLVYSIENNENYRISVDAFGFLDDADESTNNESKNTINITFDDWIFKYDGVVVTILDK